MSAVDHFNDLFEQYAGPLPGSKAPEPVFVEPCEACRGSGVWIGTYGRAVRRPCFKCKGTGKLTFKTSAVQREKSRAYAEKRKAQQSAALSDKILAFSESHPAEVAWLHDTAPRWEFAASLLEAFQKYGGLTEGQLSAVRRSIQRDADRKASWQADRAAKIAAAPVVSVAAIETAFDHAMIRGIKRPKLRLDSFKFSLAGANSSNAGAIYVTQGEIYLGKVKDGRFMRSRECDDATEKRVCDVAANPSEAAVAYGRRTGNCAICARELTRGDSIDRGIGPICAEKYGW